MIFKLRQLLVDFDFDLLEVSMRCCKVIFIPSLTLVEVVLCVEVEL